MSNDRAERLDSAGETPRLFLGFCLAWKTESYVSQTRHLAAFPPHEERTRVMNLEIALVRRGLITAAQFVDAVELQLNRRPRLGRLALETGKLTMKQVFAALEEQTSNSRPFGETVVALGYITRYQLNSLLRLQRDRTPSLADCLIELGVVDRELLAQESSRFRHEQLMESPSSTPAANTMPLCGAPMNTATAVAT
jgi:hypothetical protein